MVVKKAISELIGVTATDKEAYMIVLSSSYGSHQGLNRILQQRIDECVTALVYTCTVQITVCTSVSAGSTLHISIFSVAVHPQGCTQTALMTWIQKDLNMNRKKSRPRCGERANPTWQQLCHAGLIFYQEWQVEDRHRVKRCRKGFDNGCWGSRLQVHAQ
jgi:hypothetical protein